MGSFRVFHIFPLPVEFVGEVMRSFRCWRLVLGGECDREEAGKVELALSLVGLQKSVGPEVCGPTRACAHAHMYAHTHSYTYTHTQHKCLCRQVLAHRWAGATLRVSNLGLGFSSGLRVTHEHSSTTHEQSSTTTAAIG